MAYLSGYDYRYLLTIDGSTAGAQTDYQMPLEAYYGSPKVEQDGILEWFLRPAVYYEGTYKRAYYAFYTSDSYVKIRYFDEDTKVLSDPVTLWSSWGDGDDHCPASVIVLQYQTGDNSAHNGKLLVGTTEHVGSLQVRRSTNVEDISTWDSAVEVRADNATYANPVELSDGTLLLFVRIKYGTNDQRVCYYTSTDAGASWGGATELFKHSNLSANYFMVTESPDHSVIHCIFNPWVYDDPKDGGIRPQDIYYAKYDGINWKSADGTNLTLPLDTSTAGHIPDLVYDTDNGDTPSTKIIGSADAGDTLDEQDDLFTLCKYTPTVDGAIRFVGVKAGTSGYVKVAVYADDAGEPGDRLTYNDEAQAVSAGWNYLKVPTAVVSSGSSYWLAFIGSVDGTARKVAGGGICRFKVVEFDTFEFPSSAGSGFSSSTFTRFIQGWTCSDGDHTYLWDIKTDSNGNPYIVCLTDPDRGVGSPGTCDVYRANYDSGWSSEYVATSGRFQQETYGYPSGAILDVNDMDIIYTTPPDGNGHEQLQKWEKNGSWAKTEDITQGSPGDQFRPAAVRDAGVDNYFRIIYCYTERYEGYVDGGWDSSLFAYPGYSNQNYVTLGKNCQADFDDVRFTKSDGETELDYWLESKDDSFRAIFWVEFDSIPASPDSATFYIYYGNDEASSDSDGAATFIIFDDFERGSNGDPIGGDWTIVEGDVDISTEQAYGGTRCMKLIGGATNPNVSIAKIAGTNYAIRCRIYKEGSANLYLLHGDSNERIFVLYSSEENIFTYNGGYIDTGYDITVDQWELAEVNDINLPSQKFDLWHNGVKIADDADTQEAGTSENILKFLASGGAGNDVYIDDVIVRKWCTPEPTWGAWGSEEPRLLLLSVTDGFTSGDTNNPIGMLDRTDGLKVSDSRSQSMLAGLSLIDGLKPGDSLFPFGMLSKLDGLKLGDSPSLLACLLASDGLKMGDTRSLSVLITWILSVTEGIKLGDSNLLNFFIPLIVTDGVKLGDSLSILARLAISDGLKLGDSPLGEMVANLLRSDGMKLGDTPTFAGAILYLAIVDGLEVGDTRLIEMLADIQASDGMKVGDSSLAEMLASLLYTDGAKIGDNASQLANMLLTTADGVKIGDTPLEEMLANLLRSDEIKLDDATLVELAGTLYLSITEGIKFGDVPSWQRFACMYLILQLHNRGLTAQLENRLLEVKMRTRRQI